MGCSFHPNRCVLCPWLWDSTGSGAMNTVSPATKISVGVCGGVRCRNTRQPATQSSGSVIEGTVSCSELHSLPNFWLNNHVENSRYSGRSLTCHMISLSWRPSAIFSEVNKLTSTPIILFLSQSTCLWLVLILSAPPLRARAHQGNWHRQRNRSFREMLSDFVDHLELNGATQIEQTTT
jgi:hypothetical protein